MDYPVNSDGNNPASEKGGATVPREGFVEQLGAFLRRNLYWFLIAGFVLLLLQDIFGTHGVLAMRRSQAEAQKIEQEIHRLDDENKRLQDHVKDLKTDPSTIECIAREDMGLARPGEFVFKTHPKSGEPARSVPQQSCSAQ